MTTTELVSPELHSKHNVPHIEGWNPIKGIEWYLNDERTKEGLIPDAKGDIQSSYKWDDLNYQTCVAAEDRYIYRTVQIFDGKTKAMEEFDTLRSLDPAYVLHPSSCKEGKWKNVPSVQKYLLEYPNTFVTWKFFFRTWGESGEWSDSDILLQVLMKTRKSLLYLFGIHRVAHGNLKRGVAIGRDFDCRLFNLRSKSPKPKDDINDIHYIVKLMLLYTPQGSQTYEHLKRYDSFLRTNKKQHTISVLTPEDHTLFMVNHPSSWDLNEIMRFMGTINKLYTDSYGQRSGEMSLKQIISFTDFLDARYSGWELKLKTDPVLEAVWKEGLRLGSNSKNGNTIASYAFNCLKHYSQRARIMNQRYGSNLPELDSETVMKKLLSLFPDLATDFYEALYYAMDFGDYVNNNFTVTQILTRRLIAG